MHIDLKGKKKIGWNFKNKNKSCFVAIYTLFVRLSSLSSAKIGFKIQKKKKHHQFVFFVSIKFSKWTMGQHTPLICFSFTYESRKKNVQTIGKRKLFTTPNTDFIILHKNEISEKRTTQEHKCKQKPKNKQRTNLTDVYIMYVYYISENESKIKTFHIQLYRVFCICYCSFFFKRGNLRFFFVVVVLVVNDLI